MPRAARLLVASGMIVGESLFGVILSGPWSVAKRVGFRWLFAYLLLYQFPFPLDMLPWGLGETLTRPYNAFWEALVPWVGERFFGLVDIALLPTGSGDTTFNYVQVLCYAVLATVTAVVWTVLDRRRVEYTRLQDWLRAYVRVYLGLIMCSYGASKVIKAQFPDPSLSRLIQPFGDASPMGLLWTFMGASASYNLFSGAGEMLGGLLLVARRTTLLGALVCIGVMSNVVMLNMSYDVPVKLFSLHLLGLAVVLAAPDARRLLDFLLRNRAVPAAELRPLLRGRRAHRAAVALRTLLLAGIAAWMVVDAREVQRTYGERARKPPLYGIWSVERFTVDGVLRPPLLTDLERWRWVVFDNPSVLGIQGMDDHRRRFRFQLDAPRHLLILNKRDDPSWRTTFRYSRPRPDRLELEGTLDGQRIVAVLRREKEREFLLLSRGFHWINDYPFNR